MVRVKVRQEDGRDRARELRELGGPQLGGVGEAEPCVHEHEAVVDREQVAVHVPGPRR